MSENILFILFPGFGLSAAYFNADENGTYTSNFISTLEKIGKVFTVEIPWHNFDYYNIENEDRLNYSENIDFTLKDLNIKFFCKKIYEEVKDFDGKFVLIGHSIGSYYVYNFSQMYSDRCKYNFIIDGSIFGPFMYPGNVKFLKQMLIISPSELEEIIQNIKENNFNKKGEPKGWFKLRKFTGQQVTIQRPCKAKKFKVPTLSFRNIQLSDLNGKYDDEKDSKKLIKTKLDMEQYFYDNNNGNYNFITFIDKSHLPLSYDSCREIILSNILCRI